MVVFKSKEELLKELEQTFLQLNEGKISLTELENLVEITRELNERAIILRYKAYEEKVFGEVTEVLTDVKKTPENIQSEETIKEDVVEEAIVEEVIAEKEEVFEENIIKEEILTNENNNQSIDELKVQIQTTEPIFDFDIFDENLNEESEIETYHSEEIDEENQEKNNINNENEVVTNLDDLLTKDEGLSSTEQNPFTNDLIEEISEKEIIQEEMDLISQIEHNESLNPDEISESTPDFNPFHEEYSAEIKENYNSSDSQTEVDKKVDFYPENESETRNESLNNEDFEIFSSILLKENELSSQLMFNRIETLQGSFGINERIQSVEELFNGSTDDFSQAIAILDQSENFNEAKKQLLFYIHLNKWDLEKNIAIDFIQKVQKRFS